MDLIWKCPGDAPDPKAIARMRKHFPEPKEPMPEAWFMGREINFYTPDPYGDSQFLCYELKQIGGGIVCFPEVQYVPVWKAWFRYLLPDLILRVRTSNSLYDPILQTMLTTFFNIYPDGIEEEYKGFRVDILSLLGMGVIPHQLARESLPEGETPDRLFRDLWIDSITLANIHDVSSLPVINCVFLFCLKYLTLDEIETWGASLFQMNSLQWRLQFILTLLAWLRLLRLAPKENNRDIFFLYHILSASGFLSVTWIPAFLTFDEFIPPAHVNAFRRVIAKHLSFEVFQAWRQEILNHLDTPAYDVETWFYLSDSLEGEFREFEALLFPTSGR